MGLVRALVSVRAALMAASSEELLETGKSWGVIQQF